MKFSHFILTELFVREISACAAVHTCYVMGACNRVRSIILLPRMVGTSFVLVALTGLNISEPEHWVIWSHRTGINFPFLKGEISNTLVYLNTKVLLNCGINYIWKLGNFCLLLEHFLMKLKGFCLINSVLWWEIWNLLEFDGWKKKHLF